MHILTQEEGRVAYLHYGLFEREGESIGAAQERSTELLLSRLPPPPARLLEVGIGLGTTLARLTRLGYQAEGITPDAMQIAETRGLYGNEVRLTQAAFESFEPGSRYEAVVFQESSQYIDSEALFAKAAALAPAVIVLDEFALQPLDTPGALHSLRGFLDAASAHGFRLTEEVDLSAKAAPTMTYFKNHLPRFRRALIDDLGITDQQVDELIASGERYRTLYRNGAYGYRLLTFEG
jgi:hypothetical protein